MRDMIERMNDWNLEDVFDSLFEPAMFERKMKPMHIKTDVKEDENGYELDIDLPGFDKKEINVTLKNGYLTVSAKKEDKVESKHEENCECEKHHEKCECTPENNCGCKPNSYIRKERSYFASRSYYVGDKVKEEEIKAKYDKGVLNLYIPKQKPKEALPHKINID